MEQQNLPSHLQKLKEEMAARAARPKTRQELEWEMMWKAARSTCMDCGCDIVVFDNDLRPVPNPGPSMCKSCAIMRDVEEGRITPEDGAYLRYPHAVLEDDE